MSYRKKSIYLILFVVALTSYTLISSISCRILNYVMPGVDGGPNGRSAGIISGLENEPMLLT